MASTAPGSRLVTTATAPASAPLMAVLTGFAAAFFFAGAFCLAGVFFFLVVARLGMLELLQGPLLSTFSTFSTSTFGHQHR